MTDKGEYKSSEKEEVPSTLPRTLDGDQSPYEAGTSKEQQENSWQNVSVECLGHSQSENLFMLTCNQKINVSKDYLRHYNSNLQLSNENNIRDGSCSNNFTVMNENMSNVNPTIHLHHNDNFGVETSYSTSHHSQSCEREIGITELKPNSETISKPEGVLKFKQTFRECNESSFDMPLNKSPVAVEYGIYRSLQLPSLYSLDELNVTLQKKEELIYISPEYDESFVTVIGCGKDQATGTENIIFSRNHRTQNILVSHTNIDDGSPPPYSEHLSSYGNQQQYQNRITPLPIYYSEHRPFRTPPYHLNDPVVTMNLFDDALIRKHFVAKVYSILSVQLLVTFTFILFCAFHKTTKLFFIRNYLLLYLISTAIFFTLLLTFACFQFTRRVVPLNFLLLIIFTSAMTIMATTVTSIYSTYIVILTFAVTTLVCLVVSFIACLPCFDITGYYIYLFIASLILFIYGFIAIILLFLTRSNIAFIIYAALATILFCMYLIFDTQQLLAGKRVQLSPEEYIFGAISLYVDIIVIFLYILTLCGNR